MVTCAEFIYFAWALLALVFYVKCCCSDNVAMIAFIQLSFFDRSILAMETHMDSSTVVKLAESQEDLQRGASCCAQGEVSKN